MIELIIAAAFTAYEPFCEAKVVAEGVPTMTQEAFMETIQTIYEMGGIDAKHAQQYRDLIIEAYKIQDLSAWTKEKCGLGNEANGS